MSAETVIAHLYLCDLCALSVQWQHTTDPDPVTVPCDLCAADRPSVPVHERIGSLPIRH